MRIRILTYIIFSVCLCFLSKFIYDNYSIVCRNSSNCSVNRYAKKNVPNVITFSVFHSVVESDDEMYEYNNIVYKKFFRMRPNAFEGIGNILYFGNENGIHYINDSLKNYFDEDKDIFCDKYEIDDPRLHSNHGYMIVDIGPCNDNDFVECFDKKY